MSTATVEPKAKKVEKMYFRLLKGPHIQGDPADSKRDIQYNPGDIVPSTVDLCAEFNAKANSMAPSGLMSQKFERVLDYYPQSEDAGEVTPSVSKPKGEVLTKEVLDKKSYQELQVMAKEELVDLKGATKKEDIIRMILQACNGTT